MRKNDATSLLQWYQACRRRFGHQQWWPGETPFEIMVGAILTQNTNWTNVEKAIAGLKKADLLSIPALSSAAPGRIAEVIRPVGYFNLKAERLKYFVNWLMKKCGGDLDRLGNADCRALRSDLLTVKGIGPETADSILLYALGQLTFVCDAYTGRILFRHGMIEPRTSYAETQTLFESHLPDEIDLYQDFHAQLVQVGKHHCRRRAQCNHCPLNEFRHCANSSWPGWKTGNS